MGASEGFMDIFNKGVSCGIGDVEARFVIKRTLVKIPVVPLGPGEWNGFSI